MPFLHLHLYYILSISTLFLKIFILFSHIFYSDTMVSYTDWWLNVKPILHSWKNLTLLWCIIIYIYILMDTICQCFIKDFFVYIHEEYCSVIFLVYVLFLYHTSCSVFLGSFQFSWWFQITNFLLCFCFYCLFSI